MKITKYTNKDTSKGFFGLVDQAFMQTFGINGEQMNKICELAQDEELDLLLKILDGKDNTFSKRKQALTIVKKYI